MNPRTGFSALTGALLFTTLACGDTTANPIGTGGSTTTTTIPGTGGSGGTMGTGGSTPSGDCQPACGSGEVCVESTCHALVTLDTSSIASGSGCVIALDTANVYWMNGDLRRVAKAGGPSTLLDFNVPGPGGLVVDDTYLYWTNLAILRADKTSPGKPGTTAGDFFADEGGSPTRLVGDGATLYYLDNAEIDQVSASAPPAPQAPPDVVTSTWSLGSDAPIAVDATSIYFWSEASSLLVKQDKAGSTSTTLATHAGGETCTACGILPDGPNVYYSTAASPGSGGVVARVSTAGGQPTIVVDHDQGAVGVFAVDEGHVYFMTPTGVMKVAKGGGEPVSLGTLQPPSAFPTCMAVDETYVYWVDGTKLMRYAK